MAKANSQPGDWNYVGRGHPPVATRPGALKVDTRS